MLGGRGGACEARRVRGEAAGGAGDRRPRAWTDDPTVRRGHAKRTYRQTIGHNFCRSRWRASLSSLARCLSRAHFDRPRPYPARGRSRLTIPKRRRRTRCRGSESGVLFVCARARHLRTALRARACAGTHRGGFFGLGGGAELALRCADFRAPRPGARAFPRHRVCTTACQVAERLPLLLLAAARGRARARRASPRARRARRRPPAPTAGRARHAAAASATPARRPAGCASSAPASDSLSGAYPFYPSRR